jgi:hypothetical protein
VDNSPEAMGVIVAVEASKEVAQWVDLEGSNLPVAVLEVLRARPNRLGRVSFRRSSKL